MASTVELPGRWLTTRERAKTFIGISSGISDKDARIDELIADMSRDLESSTDRRFIPVTATKTFDYQNSAKLIFGDDLLSFTSISDDQGTAFDAANYFLYPANALQNKRPYLEIELLYSNAFFAYADTRQQAITITGGKWGYSENLRACGSLGAAISTVGATSITVADGSLYDIGQTLLIDSEQVWVSGISGNTLTVTRGMNGTTAATHSNSTAIYAVEPEGRIRNACNILVARGLHRGDTAWSDRVGDNVSGLTYFKGLPAEVERTITYYKRRVYPPHRLIGREWTMGRYRGDDGVTG